MIDLRRNVLISKISGKQLLMTPLCSEPLRIAQEEESEQRQEHSELVQSQPEPEQEEGADDHIGAALPDGAVSHEPRRRQ